jgi:hypothetical protein
MASPCLFTFKTLRFILFKYEPIEFYKNTQELFPNYVLVHEILHLGPSLTFYHYY